MRKYTNNLLAINLELQDRRKKEKVLLYKEDFGKKADDKNGLGQWKEKLTGKIPDSLEDTLKKAFVGAFKLVFQEGKTIIDKTYDEDRLKKEYAAKRVDIQTKEERSAIQKLRLSGKKRYARAVGFATTEGVGLGLLGIGLPDVPILIGNLIRVCIVAGTSYGIDANREAEQIYILRLIRLVSMSVEERRSFNSLVDEWAQSIDAGDACSGVLDEEIQETAEQLAMAMLFSRFVMGIPVVGAAGGLYNTVIISQLHQLAEIKYEIRLLNRCKADLVRQVHNERRRRESMKKMVVLEPLSVPNEVLEGMLQEKLGAEVEWTLYDSRATSDEEMIARAKDAEIVVIANQPMSANVMASLEKIELLAVAFTGFDHIPMEVCKEKGVTVCNASGYSNEAVADLVFGMTISLLRNIRECDKVVREGGTMKGLVGQELSALKFGVVGAGTIGKQVLTVAKAFGCDCYAYNRSAKEIDGVKMVDLETLMSTCDVVSVHLAMNASTRGFISKALIDMMKPTALLINCARGPIVDIDALALALNEGRLGGAGIDVFYTEPPLEAGHPLFTTPHTLLTPHVAFATDEAFVKRARIVSDNIAAFLAGSPVNVVG